MQAVNIGNVSWDHASAFMSLVGSYKVKPMSKASELRRARSMKRNAGLVNVLSGKKVVVFHAA